MSNVNISKVYFLRVPLESDYKNTLYFTSKENQESYFKSKKVITFDNDNFSYQRKDHIIRVNQHIDKINTCNYVMYQNSYYSNKWFYCFIKDMKYINDGVTEVQIETDVIQTYLFDYTIKPSFVEREHVSDDTIGKHTIPEGLETGEYICNELSRDEQLQDLCYIILTTEFTNTDKDNPDRDRPLATNFGGVFSAGGAYICSTMNEVVNIVQALSEVEGAIVGVYMAPKKIVNNTSETLQYSGQPSPVTYNHPITKQNTLDGYTPKNNKLLCFPYNYILNSNNSGTSNILQYEHFSGENCEFEIEGVPTIGCSIKCVPLNYKGIEKIQEEGIMLGKFPTLSWSADLYTSWITQNGLNLNMGVATSGLSVVAGLGMLAVNPLMGAGMIAGGVAGVANTMAQVHQHAFTPNSAKGNVNGGDINTSYKMNLFYFYKMSIKKEMAEALDKYFDMYGYKVNIVKTPSKAHRSRYWYTKTIDVNIDGNIPNNDMDKIKNCYNNGITFWRNADEIQNYSLSNAIV